MRNEEPNVGNIRAEAVISKETCSVVHDVGGNSGIDVASLSTSFTKRASIYYTFISFSLLISYFLFYLFYFFVVVFSFVDTYS